MRVYYGGHLQFKRGINVLYQKQDHYGVWNSTPQSIEYCIHLDESGRPLAPLGVNLEGRGELATYSASTGPERGQFPTQICLGIGQWLTNDNVTKSQTRSNEVTQGQIGTEKVTQGQTRSDEVPQGKTMSDKVTQVQTRSDEVIQGQMGTEKVTQGQTGSDEVK